MAQSTRDAPSKLGATVEILRALGPRVSTSSGYQLASVSHLESVLIFLAADLGEFQVTELIYLLLSYLPRASQIYSFLFFGHTTWHVGI